MSDAIPAVEEVEAVKDQTARHEIKCVLEADQVARVESWIRLHSAAFRRAYPDRRINNIYFDSPELDCFRENLSGTSSRTKCRLRWYGEDATATNAAFEFKRKRNLQGMKTRQAISFPEPLLNLSFAEIAATVARQLPEYERAIFAGISTAVLLNRYRRRYYVSFDGRIRLTVDRELVFYDQRRSRRPNTRFRVHAPAIAVLECKYGHRPGDPTPLPIVDLPARVTRCSKYALGVQWLLGY